MKQPIVRNSVDWEESGMLYGLTGDLREQVKNNLSMIDVAKLSNELLQFISPAIRRIMSTIATPSDTQNKHFKDHPELIPAALDFVDVDDITFRLEGFMTFFHPISLYYLPHLDYEAELLMLFCNNYVYEVYKNVK